MQNEQIIEIIILLYASILEEKKKPLIVEEIENGLKYVWMLENNVKLTVDQYDNPPNSDYTIEADAFTLVLKEDNENQKYYLDAPILKNEDILGAWLGALWMRFKGQEMMDQGKSEE